MYTRLRPSYFVLRDVVCAVPHADAANDVALLNLIDDVHAGDDAAEDGVLRVEVRLR